MEVKLREVFGIPPKFPLAAVRTKGNHYLLRAKSGDRVKVHYTGRVKDGGVFGSSRKRRPVSFILGEGKLLPGFEQAVLGMAPGDKKTVSLAPETGYGLPRQDLTIVSSRGPIARDVYFQIGRVVVGGSTTGTGQLPLTVTDRTECTVTLDGNHPLAGQQLIFHLELVEIVE